MKNFKSSAPKLVQFFKESRDQWKKNGLEKQKRIRALETKERDLSKSRDKWKNDFKEEKLKNDDEIRLLQKESSKTEKQKEELNQKLLDETRENQFLNQKIKEIDQERLSQEEVIKKLKQDLVEQKKKIDPEEDQDLILFKETPVGHSFPSYLIQLAIELVVDARSSLRGAEKTFQLFSKFFDLKIPTYSSIRKWIYRLGLYLLKHQEIPYREDWILIFDHTVELDHKKCLVTLLVSRSELEEHGYSLKHCSVVVVDIEIMTSSTGDLIYQKLLDLSSQVGKPLQIVSDHGPDLQKGIRLYREKHPEVIATYDVTHKMGCILKKYFAKTPRWISFSEHCTETLQQVQQTANRFLAPPKQKTKARYLNIHEQIEWAMNALNYEKRGDFSLISPCFQWGKGELDSVTEELDSLTIALSPQEYSILSSFPSQNYSNRQVFEEAWLEYAGAALFEKVRKPILEISDQGRQQYLEKHSWLSSYEKDLLSYFQVVQLVKTVGKQIKKEGIHQNSKKQFKKETKNLLLTSSLSKKIKKEIILYLDEEGEKIAEGDSLLGTSDVIESIFEKYKFFTSRNPSKELGKLVLTIPVFTAKITLSLIKKAMETVKYSDVEKYAKETFGVSMRSKREKAFNKKKNGSQIQEESEQKVREEDQNNAISKEDQMEGKIDQERGKSNPFHSAKQSKLTEKKEISAFKSAS